MAACELRENKRLLPFPTWICLLRLPEARERWQQRELHSAAAWVSVDDAPSNGDGDDSCATHPLLLPWPLRLLMKSKSRRLLTSPACFQPQGRCQKRRLATKR